jgi:hypothetical protein
MRATAFAIAPAASPRWPRSAVPRRAAAVIAQEAVIALPKTKISVAVIERPKIGIRSSRVIVTVAPAKTDPRTLLDAELQRWTIRTERPRALTGALIVRIGNLLIWITKIVVAAIAWRNGLLTERPCGSYRQREYARCTQANGQLKLHQSKRHDPHLPSKQCTVGYPTFTTQDLLLKVASGLVTKKPRCLNISLQ